MKILVDENLDGMDERLKALKDGDEGAIPEMVRELKVLNGKVRKNTSDIKWIKGIGGAIGTILATLIAVFRNTN